MSQSKLENNNEKIEELTEDKPAEVNVVPRQVGRNNNNSLAAKMFDLLVMDILQEEIHQFVPFFLLILDKSGGGSFTKELHQPALHHDPEHPGQIEEEGKEDQVQRNPLIVRVVDYCRGVHILVSP